MTKRAAEMTNFPVIPAQAGIQSVGAARCARRKAEALDPRLRGDDEEGRADDEKRRGDDGVEA
jgi:hypothetical protein